MQAFAKARRKTPYPGRTVVVHIKSAAEQATRLPEIMEVVAHHAVHAICVKDLVVGFRTVSAVWRDAFDRGLLQVQTIYSFPGYCALRCGHCRNARCPSVNIESFLQGNAERYHLVRQLCCSTSDSLSIPPPTTGLLSLSAGISKLTISAKLVEAWQGQGRPNPPCLANLTHLILTDLNMPDDATTLHLQTFVANAKSLRKLELSLCSMDVCLKLVSNAAPLHTLDIWFEDSDRIPSEHEFQALRAATEGIVVLGCHTSTEWITPHVRSMVPSTVQILEIQACEEVLLDFLSALRDTEYLPALRRLPTLEYWTFRPIVHDVLQLRQEVIGSMRTRKGIMHLEEDLERSEDGYCTYLL